MIFHTFDSILHNSTAGYTDIICSLHSAWAVPFHILGWGGRKDGRWKKGKAGLKKGCQEVEEGIGGEKEEMGERERSDGKVEDWGEVEQGMGRVKEGIKGGEKKEFKCYVSSLLTSRP